MAEEGVARCAAIVLGCDDVGSAVALTLHHAGFADENVDFAVEISVDPSAGIALAASRRGRFTTDRRIGDTVREGQIVGGLGNEAVKAPAGGVLRGLAARGARIEPGDTLVEVDPDTIEYRCFGVGEIPRRAAARLLGTMDRRAVMPV